MNDQRRVIAEPRRKDVSWAWTFLNELVDGKRPKLRHLNRFSNARHVALASVFDDAVTSSLPPMRAWGFWILSELRYVPEDAYSALQKGMQDADEEVRLAALWAAGKIPDFAARVVPNLIAAAEDDKEGIQFAAISSLANIGSLASDAVPVLLRRIDSSQRSDIRYLAIDALTSIAPDDPSVQNKLLGVLCDDDSSVRVAATAGFAQAEQRTTLVADAVRRRLSDEHKLVALMAAWALSTGIDTNIDVVPDLLHAMARIKWWEVPPYGKENAVRIGIRNDFEQALDLWLPKVEHELFASFRSHFLSGAFHPDAPSNGWLGETVVHKFYRRIQRARFPKAITPREHQRRRQLVEMAANKFFNRLRKNPTLGLLPERYRELPGYIKKHTRNIAWRLRQKKGRLWLPISFEPVASTTTPEQIVEQEEVTALLHTFIQTELTPDETAVLEFVGKREASIKEAAAALQMTESIVKTLRDSALLKLRRRFRTLR